MNSFECNSIIQLINKYCNHLNVIYFDSKFVGKRTINKLIKKFGHKLVKFENYKNSRYFEEYYTPNIIKRCPNLKKLNFFKSNFIKHFDGEEHNFLKKLESMSFCFCYSYSHIISNFFDNNKNSLKRIDIYVWRSDNYTLEPMFEQIAKLNNLVRLKLNVKMEGDWSDNVVNNSLDQLKDIAMICQQIKYIEIEIRTKTKQMSQKIFDSMKNFKNLKPLYLTLDWPEKDN